MDLTIKLVGENTVNGIIEMREDDNTPEDDRGLLTIEGSGNDRKATIFFDQVGQKTMMLVYAKLVIINQ